MERQSTVLNEAIPSKRSEESCALAAQDSEAAAAGAMARLALGESIVTGVVGKLGYTLAGDDESAGRGQVDQAGEATEEHHQDRRAQARVRASRRSSGSKGGPRFVDATKLLQDATQEMHVGELLSANGYSLWELMSTIVIMDPRMDTGLDVSPDEAASEAAFDPNGPLDVEQLIAIIDRLLVLEATWLSGHLLAQTLFTSRHLMQVHNINVPTSAAIVDAASSTDSDKVTMLCQLTLKAYVLGVVKCFFYTWAELTRGQVYEEEDISTNKFGISLNDAFPAVEALNMLASAVQCWEMSDVAGMALQPSLVQGLVQRLSFRKASRFLAGLKRLYYIDRMPDCEGAQRELRLARKALASVKDMQLDACVDFAFDPMAHRNLACQTPPRPITLMTLDESIELLNNMLSHLDYACTLTALRPPAALMRSVATFGALSPAPTAFARSVLISILLCDIKPRHMPHMDHRFVRDAILECTCAPATYFQHIMAKKSAAGAIGFQSNANQPAGSDNAVKGSIMDGFTSRAAEITINTLKARCQNRARQPRLFAKLIVDWEMLQAEAEQLDARLEAGTPAGKVMYYLSSWVYDEKLTLMVDMLTAGLELELYGQHEYSVVLWYIDYLLYNHMRHMKNLSQLVTKPVGQAGKQPQRRAEPVPLTRRRLLTMIRREMMHAFLPMLSLLHQHNLLSETRGTYDQESVRFAYRFRTFGHLGSPPPATLADYHSVTERYASSSHRELLAISRQSWQMARQLLDQLRALDSADLADTPWRADALRKEVQAFTRVCIANAMALQRLPDLLATKPAEAPHKLYSFNFKYHPWFPVLAVEAAAATPAKDASRS
ncbi:Mak10 subunit, NatC N-terminal acetyltransferase-domain-containing protein [Thamnocephalis sphaerospora]|uniref:Mak10 subunit, NatC N-terminal acetyltransferase-domain-containing protein n=1 Tax=Thamnocephalis sphaerospora TaxID=78915 RepID=A0A4P9XM61_9FUNG|nr:Mak10 subunit, NatC N-terminal acetyltransferase-domain-containing protein [Thamnocephalis sphaerospora]|eukprot:RKP06984.1 Mak10 subunit, NatC N-terminal acetyltransferase-domain-containing protein [Thamnocephalis sphaerospora]